MTQMGNAIAHGAIALVGKPFRLHGRNPETGVDCVGLVALSLIMAGASPVIPTGYSLRNRSFRAFEKFAKQSGLIEPQDGQFAPGDIVMAQVSPAQLHLLVYVGAGAFVHAHASLRKVVKTTGPLTWPVHRHWRYCSKF